MTPGNANTDQILISMRKGQVCYYKEGKIIYLQWTYLMIAGNTIFPPSFLFKEVKKLLNFKKLEI